MRHRPARPRPVDPSAPRRRDPFETEGRAALPHALAHIELDAIAPAPDACWRLGGMPAAFYRDRLRVAAEETRQVSPLRDHLRTLGHAAGDFDAHDGPWATTERTAGTSPPAWRCCRARWRRAPTLGGLG